MVEALCYDARMRVPGVVLALVCALRASTALVAFEPRLDRRALEEAVHLGRSGSDEERARFHARYRITVARPPVDWIDVITPFHRVQIAAEDRTRRNGSFFGQAEALQAVGAGADRLDLLVEMTFHPLNTFVGVPAYQVTLEGGTGEVQPIRLDRFPRFGPRLTSTGPVLPAPMDAASGRGQPVVGGAMMASFEAGALDTKGRYDVVIRDGGVELARGTIDLGRVR
jgi:hypothetical protein